MSCPNLYNGTAVVTAAGNGSHADQYVCDDDPVTLGWNLCRAGGELLLCGQSGDRGL